MPDRDGRGLDFDALLQRIHPAASRVRMLAGETPSSFVAFDLLALGDRALLDATLRERRALLETELRYGAPVLLTPSSTDRPSPSRGSRRSRAPDSTASWPSGSTTCTRPTSARW